MDNIKQIYTLDEVATVLNVSVDSVKDFINSNDLVAIGSNKDKIKRIDLYKFMGKSPIDNIIDYEVPSQHSKKEVIIMSKSNAQPYWNKARKRFEIAPYIQTPEGKKRKVFGGKTTDEVMDKYNAFINGTTYVKNEPSIQCNNNQCKITLSEVADKWWEYKKETVSQKTLDSYYYPYAEIKEFMGDKYIGDIRFDDIERYFKWKQSQRDGEYSQSVYSIRSKVLVNMFWYAEKYRYIHKNTSPMLDKPTVPTGKPTDRDARFLPLNYVNTLINVFKDNIRYSTIIKLLLASGTLDRVLCALKWSDISEKHEDGNTLYEIHIQRALVKNGNYIPHDKNNRPYVPGSTKSNSSNRIIVVGDDVYKIICDWKSYVEHNSKLSERIAEHGTKEYIFVDSFGYLINLNTLRQQMSKYMNKKLNESSNRVKFHDLRHTFASMMLENCVDMTVISRILGHSSISITSNVYTTVTDKLMIKSAESISSIVSKIS